MPRNSSNAELESAALECAARIRAVIEEDHEALLRSVAVLVAKTERRLRWAEVMEIASEVLHEAVHEALKHTHRFDATRSATAWVRGIAARLLLSRRRVAARSQRCISASVLGDQAWATALARLCTAPADASVAGRLDLE
jgi:DNA-directed RNA polymerase specialized sigma24 family protein